ncbi:MAG: hypothetical protein U0V54_05300 [Saprospiraceae bacterium]
MKVFSAKALLMIILLAGTPIGEFVKLPMLVYHMVSHFQEDPKMSLAEFFDMHYNRGLVMDEDYHQDMQLPFKASQGVVSFVWGELSPLAFPLNPAPENFTIKKTIGQNSFDLPSSYLSCIWQPPRLS